MTNLTIRNIPEAMLDKLRRLSEIERRSLNSEILVVLEKCLDEYKPEKSHEYISAEAQVALWEKLAGEWDDPRPAKEIASDILKHRTGGRKVDL